MYFPTKDQKLRRGPSHFLPEIRNFNENPPLDAPNGDCSSVSSADRARNRANSPARVALHQLIETLDDQKVQAFVELMNKWSDSRIRRIGNDIYD